MQAGELAGLEAVRVAAELTATVRLPAAAAADQTLLLAQAARAVIVAQAQVTYASCFALSIFMVLRLTGRGGAVAAGGWGGGPGGAGGGGSPGQGDAEQGRRVPAVHPASADHTGGTQSARHRQAGGGPHISPPQLELILSLVQVVLPLSRTREILLVGTRESRPCRSALSSREEGREMGRGKLFIKAGGRAGSGELRDTEPGISLEEATEEWEEEGEEFSSLIFHACPVARNRQAGGETLMLF